MMTTTSLGSSTPFEKQVNGRERRKFTRKQEETSTIFSVTHTDREIGFKQILVF